MTMWNDQMALLPWVSSASRRARHPGRAPGDHGRGGRGAGGVRRAPRRAYGGAGRTRLKGRMRSLAFHKPTGRYVMRGTARGASCASEPSPPSPPSSSRPPSRRARPGRSVPGDQPLPGYTIDNPPLAPVQVHGKPSRVLQGVHRHAAYDIEVPPRWNGRLASGRTATPPGLRAHGEPAALHLRQRLLDQGYAWAASSYYRNGYDVRAGVLSTRDVADLFAAKVGRPKQRIIVGASMGGHIIGRSLEQFPGYYDGALPMCGVLGDHELFDYFLDYNLVAQDLSGVREYPVTDRYATVTVPKIEAALGLTDLRPGGPDTTNERGRQFRSIAINRTGGARPGDVQSFAFWKDFPFTLATPEPPDATLAEYPGQLATNLFTRYEPNAPVNVNRSVQRVRVANLPGAVVEPAVAGAARQRASERPGPEPARAGGPVRAVLDGADLREGSRPEPPVAAARPARRPHGAALRVLGRGSGSGLGRPRPVDRQGPRPAGDVTTKPSTVARPDYGCRFSDRAAYAAGAGTRRLFPACP